MKLCQSQKIDFRTYVDEMSPEQLNKYAEAAGTTSKYIIKKLRFRYVMPKVSTISALAKASEGKFSEHELVLWFAGYNLPQ